ncbi:MAG: WD40 repeat domain-containing protein [Fimbriimonadaceae bacterium]|jgi:hypothetical protein|nr:WD40 repeat domain-containing protein [Fimbriimonadaceae bacterium]
MLTSTIILTAAAVTTLAPQQSSVTLVREVRGLRVAAVAGGPGSRFAVGTEQGSIRVSDARTGQSVSTLTGHTLAVYALAFSRDGRRIVSGDDLGRISLWEVGGRKVLDFPRAKGHARGIHALAFTPNGRNIASVGKDDKILFWNVTGGNPIREQLGNNANFFGIGYTSSGALITGTLADGLRIYSGGKQIAMWDIPGSEGANNIAVNPAGRALIAGRDGNVYVYSVPQRRMIGTLKGHESWVMTVAINNAGTIGASASVDGTVRVWNLTNMRQIAVLQNMSPVNCPVAFTGDGRYLITASSADDLRVYSVPTR